MEGENGDKQSRENTEEQHSERIRKAKTSLKLKLSMHRESPILLANSALRLLRQLCPEQSLGRKAGE